MFVLVWSECCDAVVSSYYVRNLPLSSDDDRCMLCLRGASVQCAKPPSRSQCAVTVTGKTSVGNIPPREVCVDVSSSVSVVVTWPRPACCCLPGLASAPPTTTTSLTMLLLLLPSLSCGSVAQCYSFQHLVNVYMTGEWNIHALEYRRRWWWRRWRWLSAVPK